MGDAVLADRALVRRNRSELAAALEARTAPAELVTRDANGANGANGALRCSACAHRCVFDGDRAGACGVRFARGGELRVPFGYVARRYVRAVETNTIYHVLPGAKALTFGMFGCDLRCPYCQNARVSQALREDPRGEAPSDVSARALVDEAEREGCEVVCAAYNEPMIAAEWLRAVFGEARARGMRTAIISDGHSTPEALAYLRDVTDVFRVDLKGFDQEQYRALGGRLDAVMATIREAKRLGYWVEIVTLVVPGFNDSASGLRRLAKDLVAIDPDMPWHLNAFYPRYRMRHVPRTDVATLVSAAGTAYARGVRFVYVSNVASELTELSHTRCPSCAEILVRRADYATLDTRALRAGACARCGARIPGLFR
jgi:pyruvate formate lyase activating enzyme